MKRRKPPSSSIEVLDRISVGDIRNLRSFSDKYIEYHWELHHDLERQRRKIRDHLFSALRQHVTMDFEFSGWQRAVSYRYSLTPLSTLGSTIGDAGGRFNIGALDPMVFPVFPALYIAEDRTTAEHELLLVRRTILPIFFACYH